MAKRRSTHLQGQTPISEDLSAVGQQRERKQIIASVSRVMNGEEEELDQDARDAARDAIAKIVAHEAVCTERWGQQRIALDALTHSVSVIQKTLDSSIGRGPAGLIAFLTGLCSWLAARAFPLH